jgi:lambda family phage portal protein
LKFSLQLGRLNFNVGFDKPALVNTTSKRSYAAGAINRLTNDWTTTVTSADVEARNDVGKVRSRARDGERNDSYSRNYYRLLKNNVLGWQGIKFQEMLKDVAGDLDSSANEEVEQAWNRWGKKSNCTIQKNLSSRRVCLLALISAARDGGAMFRFIPGANNEFGFALQMIEVDHLDYQFNVPDYLGNEIRMGVELSPNKEPVAYWLWTRHPGDYNAAAAFKRIRVPAEEIIHLYWPGRMHETIGMPWASASMFPLNMLSGYQEAEVTAARVAACKGGYIEKKTPDEFTGDEYDERGNKVEEMEPGVVKELDPGETFKEHNPTHPNTAYGLFTKTVLRSIAAGMGVSYEALAKDLENVNYSSIRAGVLDDREEYKSIQEWFIEDFCEQVFEKWVPFAILSGQIKQSIRRAEDIIEAATWLGRRWSWVDPLKDINATVVAIENRLESRTGAVADQGGNFEELLDEIEEEERLAEEKGVSLPQVEPPLAQIEDEAPAGQGNGDNTEPAKAGNGKDPVRPKKKKRWFHAGR